MPSRLNLREKLKIRPKSATKPGSSYDSSVSLLSTTTTPTPTVDNVALDQNLVFKLAFQKHVDALPQVEKDAFQHAYASCDVRSLVDKVRVLDEANQASSNFRRWADPLSRFFELLQRTLGIAAISTQSSLEGSLVVGGVKLLVDLTMNSLTFFNKLNEMISEIAEHLGHLEVYATKCGSRPIVLEAVAAIYGDILDFCRRGRRVFVKEDGTLHNFSSARTFIRIQWEPFEASFGSIRASLSRHLQILAHASQAETLVSAQRLVSSLDDEQRAKIMTWLSDTDMEAIHTEVFKKKQAGTAQWLIDEPRFQEWTNSEKSSLLWCFGGPGKGKTVLAANALDHISHRFGVDQSTGTGYFYCRHDAPSQQRSVDTILSVFLKQIVSKLTNIPQVVVDFYHQYSRDARKPLVDKLTALLREVVDKLDQAYLFVDGLDEFDEDDRLDFLEQCKELTSSSHKFRIFITSRSEEDLRRESNRLHALAILIEVKSTEDDIRRYVECQIDYFIERKLLRLRDPTLREEIAETLIDKADGMFLWISLQLQTLSRERTDRDIRIALYTVPKKLSQTYERMLLQIEQKSARLQTIAKISLTWVMHAQRRLQLEELLDIVNYRLLDDSYGLADPSDMYDAEAVFDACSNLLYAEDGIVRPVHYSVQEFFMDLQDLENDSAGLGWRITPEAAHAEIAEDCVCYLLQDSLQDGPFTNWERFFEDILLRHPCVLYAAHFFDRHIVLASSHLPESLRKLLARLLLASQAVISTILQLRGIRSLFQAEVPRVIQGFGCVRDEFVPLHDMACIGDLIYSSELFKLRSSDVLYVLSDEELFNKMPISKLGLHYACQSSLHDCVRELLDRGYGGRQEDGTGAEAIHYAAAADSETICQMLLDAGHDPNVSNTSTQWTPLHIAAQLDNMELANLLLENGAQVDARSAQGVTPLLVAVGSGSVEMCMLFIDYGADINILTIDSSHPAAGSPLYKAASDGGLDLVKELLSAGADPNLKTEKGYPLQIACRWSNGAQELETLQCLIDAGATMDQNHDEWGTALMTAASYCHTERAQALLQNHADFAVENDKLGTALLAALNIMSIKEPHRVSGLFISEAEPTGRMGRLHKRSNIISLLIDAGADVNQRAGVGARSPLQVTLDSWEALIHIQLGQLEENGIDIEYDFDLGMLRTEATILIEGWIELLLLNCQVDLQTADPVNHTDLLPKTPEETYNFNRIAFIQRFRENYLFKREVLMSHEEMGCCRIVYRQPGQSLASWLIEVVDKYRGPSGSIHLSVFMGNEDSSRQGFGVESHPIR